jgi:hypothetical protein
VRAFESIAKSIAIIAVPKYEEINKSGNKEIETKNSSADSQMNEVGQSIIDKLKKILLGS